VSETVRVFVNGKGVDAVAGGTALDAIALHAPDDADRVRAGELLVTDSRGLPVPADSALFNGAVFRIVPNRERDASDPAARFDA
jgi:hypothetical protein